MGVVIFGVIALYLAISFTVVLLVARTAKRKGKSPLRWGVAAALVMYLLVFWDHIPTLATHRYYCETEGGFWVYKTVDQWNKENPSAMSALRNKGDTSSHEGDMNNFVSTHALNQRISSVLKKSGPFLFHRWRWEHQVVDLQTGEALARRIEFSTGNGRIGGEPEVRFWLHRDGCAGNADRASRLNDFTKQFKGAEK